MMIPKDGQRTIFNEFKVLLSTMLWYDVDKYLLQLRPFLTQYGAWTRRTRTQNALFASLCLCPILLIVWWNARGRGRDCVSLCVCPLIFKGVRTAVTSTQIGSFRCSCTKQAAGSSPDIPTDSNVGI